ncbi:MAG TPA: penicillin acylase family protein, partial [Longimicrobiales bacterium]|nr:penicillin acylase family protein [Longimicrobiales bacterium]
MSRLTPRAPRALLALVLLAAVMAPPAAAQTANDLARQVEIRRTTYGVPHIKAENLRAAYYALAWVQLEDYGDRVPVGLLRSRGQLALTRGPEATGSDFLNRMGYARAQDTYHLVDADTRAVYEGFAVGVNRYIELHPEEFPDWNEPPFTGLDVHAAGVVGPSFNAGGRVINRLERLEREAREQAARTAGAGGAEDAEGDEGAMDPEPTGEGGATDVASERQKEDGSNAWALHPSRTRSGEAILLRNPHLSWTAGYYEGHIRVPGVLDFYGDFRIGSPFGVIGGFNERLGWATTNNDTDRDEVYALDVDPERPDHYLFDGASFALRRELVTVEFRNGPGVSSETREFWTTPLGPVVHRAGGKVYVARLGEAGEYRAGEQFLRMMRAQTLEEWKDAMRMHARATSSFTYADADGNILYVWNGTVPDRPHPSGGDTLAIPARRTDDVWTRLIPWDSLPQVLNPRGGYLHNENDSFHFANLNETLLPAERWPDHFEQPRLRTRSQHAVQLIQGRDKLSLEDVVERKHSYRMLLADRVKPDLAQAVRADAPAGEVAEALALLERWDNRAAHESRGAVLFQTWWDRYRVLVDSVADELPDDVEVDQDTLLYAEAWSIERPMETPRGLGRPDLAAQAFAWAVPETARRFGAWDVAWGEVHRVRRGDVDEPVGGCGGALGCFRVLNFSQDDDGKRAVNGGDGWVLAVEFTSPPRGYSVLAYGQTPDEESPHYDDQAAMFARGEMKPIRWTERDIE